MGEKGLCCKTSVILPALLPSPEHERNLDLDTKDVSAHYLVSLCLIGMKVTAPNLTCSDGNLSDTPNNPLMQKLKGLSVSLGGREEQWCIMELTSKIQVVVLQLTASEPRRHEGTDMLHFSVFHFLELPYK